MKIPRFPAEASLHKTNRHYRMGGHMVTSSAQIGRSVRPAAREQEGEVIHVHSCPPGWTDYGGTCFPPPVTEPPVGGSGEEGEATPPYDGSDDGEPYGKGKGRRSKTFLERIKPAGGRYCRLTDIPGTDPARLANAEIECANKRTKSVDRQLACFDNQDGTVSASCCHVYLKNISKGKADIDRVICIHAEEVPPK